jgi:hypothetical protein
MLTDREKLQIVGRAKSNALPKKGPAAPETVPAGPRQVA